MKNLFFAALVLLIGVSSCSKDKYDAEAQAAKDEQLIKDFISANNIQGAVRHESGLYYVINAPGTGNVTYSSGTSVTAKYTGKLLSGQVFDSNTTGFSFKLGQVIPGWQIGIPLIQRGGKIRLLIPSALAYGNTSAGSIPPNSVLDFTVELL
jgi:FKBP-type peptidyl-prolyl cis-trans isomerase FkpA